MMDRARAQTDKRLERLDKEIGRVYKSNPALLAIEREYAKYMASVKKRTDALYSDYINEKDEDIKKEKKDAYMGKLRALTLDNKEYKRLVANIAHVLAEVNQQALDISNKAMREVYALNYNQVAEDCREAGIEIDGKE